MSGIDEQSKRFGASVGMPHKVNGVHADMPNMAEQQFQGAYPNDGLGQPGNIGGLQGALFSDRLQSIEAKLDQILERLAK